MVLEVKMPALSPTMTEGKIISWNKKKGDKVLVGDVLLEVETDKAIMEVEAQEKGVFGKNLVDVNTTVEVGKTIALILEKGETEEDIKNYKIEDDANKNLNLEIEKEKNNLQNENKNTNNINTNQVEIKENNNHIFASPLAKNIAKINNINIEEITNGSGPNGRIIKQDIEKFLSNHALNLNKTIIGRNNIEYIDIEPTNMRTTIANRLSESKNTIPHWYLKTSVDMSNVINFRVAINKMAKIINDKPEFKVSINDIIVMLVAKALRKNDIINASWINGKIRKYNNIDVSIACSVDGGLLTPVIKNADQLNILELSKTIKNIVKKARDFQLQPADYTGGSITISNLGMYNVEEFNSIINPPQSCILAVGTIKNQVVVNEQNNIEIKPICNLVFSADHRIIDGENLAKFSNDVKTLIENPALMDLF